MDGTTRHRADPEHGEEEGRCRLGSRTSLLWTRYFATKMEELSRVDGFACWLRIALLRAVWLACGCVAGLVTNLRLAGVKG